MFMSVLTVEQMPKRETNPDKNASTIVCAWMSAKGITSGQRLNPSTMMNNYLLPREGGSGPTMSRCTCVKQNFVEGK